MADVFLSFSLADTRVAVSLIADLKNVGVTVWAGSSFDTDEPTDEAIRREIAAARCVIVIWSPTTAKSDWIKWQASFAHQRGILIPVIVPGMDVGEIPTPFGNLQTELVTDREKIFSTIANKIARFRDKPKSAARSNPTNHLVILVHGINTRALWMGRVKETLERAGFRTELTSFGQFSLFRFLAPFRLFRRYPVQRVIGDIKHALAIYERRNKKPPEKLSVICHSFGTYVIAEILAKNPELKWHRIIFAGSVVREDYDFHKVIDQFDDPLLNEVGTRDFWPALAESAGWGYGSIGSAQLRRPGTVTRWHKNYAHSDFLTPEFCEEFWVPFLRGEAPKAAADATPMPLWVRIVASLPLRWIIAMIIPALLVYSIIWATSPILEVSGVKFNFSRSQALSEACNKYPAMCNLPDNAQKHIERDLSAASSGRGGQLECFNGIGNCPARDQNPNNCVKGLGDCAGPGK